MTTGDFSQDAYKQLREQYAQEAQNARDEELAGVDIQGQQLGIETLPVDAPWRSKIDNWQYPDGKSSYQDGQQSPDEILQIMRDAAEEKIAAAQEAEGPDFDAMDDEEFNKFIDSILDDEEAEEGEEDTEEPEEDVEEDEEVEEEEPEAEPEEEEAEEEPEEEEEEPEGEALEAEEAYEVEDDEDEEFDGVGEDEELEEELENPKKADLDKDGKLSGYEKKRGKAIERDR